MNTRFVSLLAAFALAACGSSTEPGVDASVSVDAAGSVDAFSAADAPATTTGTLHGDVTRTAMPRADGIGDLFVAVFDRDPVTEMAEAQVVAAARLEDVDMSSADARIAYEVTGIPPRAEPYFVIAFLDDNDNVTDPTMAAPDRGDLVTIEGFGAPSVTVSEPVRVDRDLVLNLNVP